MLFAQLAHARFPRGLKKSHSSGLSSHKQLLKLNLLPPHPVLGFHGF
jgi:hypothetical protein